MAPSDGKHSHLIILVLLWAIVTGINLGKAFHIDDTFHLECAKWIAHHPAKPMSGNVVWYDNIEKFHHHNQPALLFYLITIVGEIFGYSEIPLHLLLSIFTFLALYFFLRILQRLDIPNAGLLLALFALCPAFIVNQNLMTDIPILSLELAFIYHLLQGANTKKSRHSIFAGIALGLALLIKYSIIPLFVVMVVAILIQKNYRQLPSLLIPLGMLGLWSLFNKIEYGGIHLMDRPKNELTFSKVYDQVLVFAACIGAVAPFSVAFFYGAWRKKIISVMNVAIFVFIAALAILVYQGSVSEPASSKFLNRIFMINGGLMVLLLLVYMTRSLSNMWKVKTLDVDRTILYTWIVSISGFMILYAPFMATRHILLILPCMLILGAGFIEKAGKFTRNLAFATTAVLGILLGISDWHYADFYRRMPAHTGLPENARVWSSGHWGWQWYSSKNGMMTYSTDSADVRVGDYLVYPLDISRQKINERLKLTEIKRISEPAGLSTFFSGKDFASLYNAYTYKGSWTFSREPIDTILVSRIDLIEADTNELQK